MKKILVFVLCLVLSGCATTTLTNELRMGMTRDEVIKIMGQPLETKAQSGAGQTMECLVYALFNRVVMEKQPYWLMFREGRLYQYGRAGDFGTTIPEDRREYDIKMQNKK